jgi:hypothetical protein
MRADRAAVPRRETGSRGAARLLRQSRVPALLAASFHLHRWLIGLILVYVLACGAIAAHFGRLGALDLTMYAQIAPPATAILALAACLRLLAALVRARPARPVPFLVRKVRAGLSAERLTNAVPLFLVLPPFMSVFTSMKTLIPVLNPYHWDGRLAAWDRMLHFGVDPWRLLQPVIGHLWATFTLSWLYQLWFVFIFGAWFVLAFATARPRLRMQYLLASVLVWAFIGTFAAALLSSGGPVYYGRLVGGPDPFVPLIAYLHHIDAITPVPAVHIQDMLWRIYNEGHRTIGSGISAMPSMHVATTVLFALLLRGRHRVLGLIGFLYAGLILVGSVHLGWHYALDGYVSLVAAPLLWKAAGWVVRRMPEFAEADPAPAARPAPA